VSLLTPLGATVLLASAVAWVVAATVGWIELLLGATTGLLVVALCGVFTISRARPRVELEPMPRRLVRGETATVEVRVWNNANARMLPLELEIVVNDQRGGPASVETFALPSVAGQGLWRDTFPVVGARRGVITIGPATTVRGDPLGLLERRVRWTDVTSLYVHPATIPLAPLGTGLLRDLEGRATSELSMSDLAFHTLREYAPGDDRRYIHWRSSAKAVTSGGKLMVRQFQDTRRTQLLVVIDGDRAAYRDPEEFELAISAGASIARQAVRDELDVTLLVADQQVKRRGGQRVTHQIILDACSRAEHTHRPLADLVGDGVRQARDVTYAVVVTGPRSFADVRRAASRVPRHVRTVVLRVAPQEKKGVSPGAVAVLTLNQLTDLRTLLQKGDAA
jgi:uncharacterized protein (DUF58 family)